MLWRVGRLSFAVLLGHGVLGITAAPASAAPTPSPDPFVDGRTVYCLKGENAGPLVDAAEKLGLAKRSANNDHVRVVVGGSERELSLQDWARSTDSARFQQACAALAAEQALPKAPSDSLWSRISQFVIGAALALAGAIFTLAGTLVTVGRAERRRAADDLRKAADDYYRTCHAWLGALRDGRSEALTLQAAVEAPFYALIAQLHRSEESHRSWRLPMALRKFMENLDRAIQEENWTSGTADKATRYLKELERARSSAQSITQALLHPRRSWRRMRKEQVT
jgi:hypothetical protein